MNYYFAEGTFNNSLSATLDLTRLEVAKEGANALVDSITPASGELASLRLGLTTYNAADGGKLLTQIDDLTPSQATSIKSQINALTASSNTPLAETLSDIGRYFSMGYTGNLTLHPGTASQATATVASTFNNHCITSGGSQNCNLTPPIQSWCQKSFVVLLSDGLPSSDRNLSTPLRDYDSDCDAAHSCLANNYDMKCGFAYPGGNGTCSPSKSVPNAGSESSDYLDDVAQALHEIDLRPDLTKPSNTYKNNLTIYTVGFADPAIDPSQPGVNTLLADTAAQGGGEFYYASSGTALGNALKSTVSAISGEVGSSASVATNSSRVEEGSTIYQAMFDSTDWIGSFLAYGINTDGSINPTPLWNAAEKIPSPYTSRTILTYNPSSHTGTTFACANLTSGTGSQRELLGIADCNDSNDLGVWRLNYLRGDSTHEKPNSLRHDTENETRSSDPNVAVFRNRTHLNVLNNDATGDDPWLLGDIVNSNPVFVGTPDYGYKDLTGTEGTSYASFREGGSYTGRTKMIYVGANDGMLHGFNAHGTGTDAGVEKVAFVPNAVYGNFTSLSDPNFLFNHRYFVDGSPRAGDAYFGGAWHTVLVGTTGAGGHGVFALDATNPDAGFSASDVLWEFSDTDAPVAANLTTDSSSLRGFQNNLGYTMTQASIVRMKDGSWAAVLGNGYGSVNNKAVLYIVNAQNGNIIRALSTETGSSTEPNGLSTPIAVDVDSDRVVDYIYAGDLQGNLWKFDVSSTSASSWNVAYSGTPLFVACDRSETSCATAHRQPITSKPQVGAGSSGGYMVYFGTGKYFESMDNDVSAPQTQTFYGVWDNGATVQSRADLQEQTIVSEADGLRLSSENPVDYPTKKGWFMDLRKPGTPLTYQGERVISFPQLRGTRVIFTTLIPLPTSEGQDQCTTVSDGTGWLMELTALTGTPLPTSGPAPWDINQDGVIDSNDTYSYNNNTHNVSGIQSTVGMPTAPGVIKLTDDGSDTGCREMKYIVGSSSQIESRLESCTSGGGASSGRQAWRQLR
ncbi:pilus assembly protein [Methylomagnum sp.]